MEIGPINIVGREIAVNRQNVGSDSAQKTLDKLKEIQEDKVRNPVGQIHRNRQGCIDIFA